MPVETAAQLAKPPMKEPQLTPALFNRSPMFCPDIWICTRFGFEHVSKPGSPSLITAPVSAAPAMNPVGGRPFETVPSNVVPATRFSSPGVDGPNDVPNELSLSAKCCA